MPICLEPNFVFVQFSMVVYVQCGSSQFSLFADSLFADSTLVCNIFACLTCDYGVREATLKEWDGVLYLIKILIC